MGIFIGDIEIGDLYVGSEQAVALYIGDEQVWPSEYKYELSNVVLRYSAGSIIKASGDNYAYLTATVTTKMGQTIIDTQDNVKLIPHIDSGDINEFEIDDENNIWGYNRGTDVGEKYVINVYGTYKTSDDSLIKTVEQQANESYGVKYKDDATAEPAGISTDITYEGTPITVGVHITQTAYDSFTSGDYHEREAHATKSATTISGSGPGGYADGNKVVGYPLNKSTNRSKIYTITEIVYEDLNNKSYTISGSWAIYQEAVDIRTETENKLTTFTINGSNEKTIDWDSTSDLTLYTAGKHRTKTTYKAASIIGGEKVDYGTWSTPTGVPATFDSDSPDREYFDYSYVADTRGYGTVTPHINDTRSDRELILDATWGNSEPMSIILTQEHGTITYGVTISPSTYIFPASGETKTLMVYGDTYINGTLYDHISLGVSDVEFEGSVKGVTRISNSLRFKADDLGTNPTSGTTGNITVKWKNHNASTKFATGQKENKIEETIETTTDFTIDSMFSATVIWQGQTNYISVTGHRDFSYYNVYTSGSSGETQDDEEEVTASTINIRDTGDGTGWITISGTKIKVGKNYSIEREARLEAWYDGIKDTCTISQYGIPTYKYNYTVDNFKVVPNSINYNDENKARITGLTKRQTIKTENGTTTTGEFVNYSNTEDDVERGAIIHLDGEYDNKFYLAAYTGSTKDRTAIEWVYTGSTGYGAAYIYARGENTSGEDYDIDIVYTGSTISFIQKCQEPYINVSGGTINYKLGATRSLTVDSNIDWTPSSNQSWVDVSKDGNTVKCVVLSENTGATRNATITVRGTGSHSSVSDSATLTQAEGYTFSIDTSTLNISAGSEDFGITFDSSRGGSYYSGVTVSFSGGNTMGAYQDGNITRQMGNKYLAKFKCLQNTSTGSTHGCTVVLKQTRADGDNPSLTCTVTQAKKPYITIAETYTREYAAGTFEITVLSNVNWTATSSDESWCTVTGKTNAISVHVTENGSTDRQAIITLTGGGVTASCTLTQKANVPMITINIRSKVKTSAFKLFYNTGAEGDVIKADASPMVNYSKEYKVPKGTVVKSWEINGAGLSYCNFAGDRGTEKFIGSGVWQNTNTSITLEDGKYYDITGALNI